MFFNPVRGSQGFLQQLRQIAARMSGGPRGAGLGLKLLAGAGVVALGLKEATYTGTLRLIYINTMEFNIYIDIYFVFLCAVEGGQRAIIFNRVGGMQMDTVLSEGLHFK